MLQDLINYQRNVKKIKILQKKIFIKSRKHKNKEARKNRVLVSLSDKDMQLAKVIKNEKESLANHVYKFYKKGLSVNNSK